MGPRHLKVKKLEAPGWERGGERKRKKMDGGPGKLLRQGGGGWADDDHVSDADVDHDSVMISIMTWNRGGWVGEGLGEGGRGHGKDPDPGNSLLSRNLLC